MKKLSLLLALMLTLMMTGCATMKDATMSNNAAPKDTTVTSTTSDGVEDKVRTGDIQYNFTKVAYSDQNVKINYPRINNLSDSGKQQRINELIKTSVLEVLNDYKDSISNLSLTMDYEVKYKGADLLSIEYLGLANVKDAAHPVNVIQTTNIDLEKEKQLVFSNVVTVNDSFVKKIKAGKYKAYRSDLDLEAAGALKDVLDGFGNQDLVESFKPPTAKFYFTKDSLGVSTEVAHAVGDHLEMELEYKSLGGLLLVKPQGSAENSGSTLNVSAVSTPTVAPRYIFESKDDIQNKIKSKVGINTYHEEPTSLKDKNTITLNGLMKGEFVEIVVEGEIKDFKYVELKWDDKQNTMIETRIINKFDKLINQTIVIKTYMPDGIPSEKIEWKTISGKSFEFIIAENDLKNR
ncbi:MAG TPA: hypothetical protein DIC60_06795 [Lachnospiraceae bacterium]|nr:hypothetical protein [Lachnospiraceae bacterium]